MKEIICGIYEIVNKVNGEKYIGQRIDIYKRWRDEKSALNKDEPAWNIHLWRAWKKYGEINFVFNIIEQCDVIELDEREKYWIAYYDSFNNGYNMTIGGQGMIGFTHNPWSDERREHMSVINSGELNPMYGKTHSEEYKDICRDRWTKEGNPNYNKFGEDHPWYGKHHTTESKDKIRKSKIGANNPSHRSVYCYELNKFYNTVKEATEDPLVVGAHISNIVACCRQKAKSCGHLITGEKLHWKYADEIINHSEINELAM